MLTRERDDVARLDRLQVRGKDEPVVLRSVASSGALQRAVGR